MPAVWRVLCSIIEQLARARAEFKAKTQGASRIDNTTQTGQHEGTARMYRLDGTPATDPAKGIVISNGHTVLKKAEN